MPAYGTKLPNGDVRSTVAIGGKPDMTRTAQFGREDPNRTCPPQGGNCGILRQTRWDGSMKRRTLKWHLLLVLSVLVSCDCSTTPQDGLSFPPLRRSKLAP